MARTKSFSDSDAESFHSFDDGEPQPPDFDRVRSTSKDRVEVQTSTDLPAKPEVERFSPEEEATLVAESNSLKGSGNQLFGKGSFENAIQSYDRALASCPNYLDYEIAVLRSNIAACHIKLEEWKEAVESATKGIECLERLEPLPRLRKPEHKETDNDRVGQSKSAQKGQGQEETLVEEVNDDIESRIEALQKAGRTLDEVKRLQVKLLLRRAKSRAEQNSWSTLQGADEDYQLLLSPSLLPSLSPTDRRQVVDATRVLGPKLAAAREREMAEMMDKLKGLGNTILKPFGLSTNNFQFVKDEKTGGYSMNFSQNPGNK